MQVSVIIPTFNRAREVPRAISSVLAQTRPPDEIIVVDDGSTDDTPEVLERFGKAIRVIRQANAGPSAARNRGIFDSRGDVLMFLDSDDEWLPGKVERQISLLERAGSAVSCCWCNTLMRHADGTARTAFEVARLHPKLDEGLWLNVLEVVASRFILLNQGLAVRREAITRVGGFDESLRLMEDHDLAFRLARLEPWAFISECLVQWNGGAANSLSAEAYRDQLAVLAASRDVLERAVRAGLPSRRVRGLLKRGLIRLKLTQLSVEMGRETGWRGFMGGVLKLGLRCERAAFTRLSVLPRMAIRAA